MQYNAQVCSLCSISPPYTSFKGRADVTNEQLQWGDALVWWPSRGTRIQTEFGALRSRLAGVPLYIVLPPPDTITTYRVLLGQLHLLSPAGVLPHVNELQSWVVRELLAEAPADPAMSALHYLEQRKLISEPAVAAIISTIFSAARRTSTVSKLAREMMVSRRTLGRFFLERKMPKPSHFLQFARLFNAVLIMRSEAISVGTAARRLGYPDGFTFSNQAKRLIGYRPSELRHRLGWEWLIEAWLQREGWLNPTPSEPQVPL